MLFLHTFTTASNERADSTRKVGEAKNLNARFNLRVSELERRMDRLALACQALWELLQERNDIPEEKVFEKMEEIDLRDGSADGRISPQVEKCSCGHNISSTRRSCIYCGKSRRGDNIVD